MTQPPGVCLMSMHGRPSGCLVTGDRAVIAPRRDPSPGRRARRRGRARSVAGRRPVEPHRSPIALALSAGRHPPARGQPDRRVGLAGRHARRAGSSTSWRPATSPPGVAISRDGTPGRRHPLVRLRPGPARRSRTTASTVAGRVEVGPEPRGVVLAADGKTAYVAVGVANEVVQVDLEPLQVTGRLAVGREPRGSPSRPTARSCSSATPDRRTSRSSRRDRWASSGRSRSRATTSARWPSAPTASTATSPT